MREKEKDKTIIIINKIKKNTIKWDQRRIQDKEREKRE